MNETNVVTSVVTGKSYNPSECVRILNLVQVEKYLEHKAECLDIWISNGKVVFVFNKEDTYELYDKWCKREL